MTNRSNYTKASYDHRETQMEGPVNILNQGRNSMPNNEWIDPN